MHGETSRTLVVSSISPLCLGSGLAAGLPFTLLLFMSQAVAVLGWLLSVMCLSCTYSCRYTHIYISIVMSRLAWKPLERGLLLRGVSVGVTSFLAQQVPMAGPRLWVRAAWWY